MQEDVHSADPTNAPEEEEDDVGGVQREQSHSRSQKPNHPQPEVGFSAAVPGAPGLSTLHTHGAPGWRSSSSSGA